MLVYDFIFPRERLAPVDLVTLYFDPEFGGVLDVVENFGVVQQNLCGDAAHVEAGATEEAVFFHDDGLQSPFGGADCGDVAARSAANNRQIVCSQTSSNGSRVLVRMHAIFRAELRF